MVAGGVARRLLIPAITITKPPPDDTLDSMADEPRAADLQEAAAAGELPPASDDLPTLDRVAQVILGGGTPTEQTAVALSTEEVLDPVGLFGASLGQYELIRPLGRGGMGQVFLARDTRLGRLVALKFMRRQNREHTRRFLDEARATARCNHPNIVTIYEVDEHQGHPYMVLEYLAGKTLRQWMEQRQGSYAWGGEPGAEPAGRPGPGLSASYVAELMLPVVRALVYAHELGLVHRDLKPENIMMAESGVIKVLDFGIAKMLAADGEPSQGGRPVTEGGALTQTGTGPGTAYYMAPEQWGGDEIDHRVDIWAAGIILHELVTGTHPLGVMGRPRLAALLGSGAPMPRLRELRPDLGKLGAVIDRCLIKRKQDRLASARELLTALESLAAPRRGRAPDDDVPPYAGLAAFRELDAERFFGRSQTATMVIHRVAEQPLLVLVGPSGAGKSSFVRAGVVPALDRTGDAWESFVVRPGAQPLAALASLLLQRAWDMSTAIAPTAPNARSARQPTAELAHATREELCARLRAEPGYLGAQLRARARRRLARVVLFVDQFEELYTLSTPGERAAFFACLAGVADDVAAPLRVIIALRSDFLDRATDAQAALPGFHRGLMLLPPMDREGLREALVRPLEAAGYGFEEWALVEDMLDALEHTASALPLLQFTATKLWELRDRRHRLLTSQSYRDLGGVAGILASHADAVLGAMTAADRALARALLLRLVTPERTRAIVRISELRELAPAPDELDRVLAHLVDARLLVVEIGAALPDTPRPLAGLGRQGKSRRKARPAAAPEAVPEPVPEAVSDAVSAANPGPPTEAMTDATVEIVHESLIRSWPTLAAWIDDSHDDLAFLARVRHVARAWHADGRPDELVWRGQVAERVRAWQQRVTGELNQVERDYLAAVLALAARANRQRRLVVTSVIAALAVIASVMAVLAWRERAAFHLAAHETERARQAAESALDQARLARDAGRMAVARELERDPTTVLALLREVEERSLARAWPVLVSSAIRAGVARAVLGGHDDQVFTAVFSPDGKRVATASWDGTARVWPADGASAPIVLAGHEDRVFGVAFSPDGNHLVTASNDRTARIWRTDGQGQPIVLTGHGDGVRSATFSPDGARVLTASNDRTARIWRADGAGAPIVLAGHTDQLRSAAFSPDGTRVVTAAADSTARIWNADGTGAPIVLAGHTDRLFSAVFSPDGRRVLTASADRTARVWSADGAGAPIVLSGHEGWILDAVFDRTGQRVATAGLDNTARVWSADGTGAPLVLTGHGETVYSVRFTADATQVVTASSDKTARVWSLDGTGKVIILRGHGGLVRAAELSPDGARIVTASEDRTARVWDARGVPEPRILISSDTAIYSVALSPDGTRLLSTSADGTARVRRLGGAAEPIVLSGHAGGVPTAAFHPGGTRVATGSFDKTVRIWSADGTGAPLVLEGHTGWISEVDFSPDGRRIASASADHTVRIWNVDGAGEPVVLTGHGGEVLFVRFSADGQYLVSASADKTVRVWRPDGSHVRTLAHPAAVYAAHFSPDGARIVTACGDAIARVWSADGSGEPILLQGHADSLTWASFSPDGTRVVTASRDNTAWIWRADGAGTPIILRGHSRWVGQAAFTPDGTQVVTSSEDGTVRLWTDIAPIEIDEDWLWRTTSYCIPAPVRGELLNTDLENASAQHAACIDRLSRAHAP
jgi:WD40 repeat protein/serine/threonine protein kinase